LSRVTLRPKVAYAGASPSAEQLASLHDRAHHECYIANSVTTKVTVE
jgi:organic hydroperoxide reductase OsmC/OhrA